MTGCSAFGCTNRTGKHSKGIPGVTYHKFPKDEPRRYQWIMAVRRKDWLPSEYSALCSEHFTSDMFDRSMKRVLLKPAAVPTLFPAHLQKATSVWETSNSSEEDNQIVRNDTNFDTPFTPDYPKSVYKRTLEEAEKKNERHEKKIKVLQTKHRYKKRCSLNSIIQSLKEQRCLSDDACSVLEVAAEPNKELFSVNQN